MGLIRRKPFCFREQNETPRHSQRSNLRPGFFTELMRTD
jgi:hypothetical protein